jgi:hypothetical protein
MVSAPRTNIHDDTTMFIILLLHSSGSGTCCYADQYSDGKDCQSCIDGANCSFLGSKLATLQLKPGYWRASSDTTDIRECWLAEACVKNNTLTTTAAATTTAAIRRITDTAAIDQVNGNDVGNIYCADGYKGPCKFFAVLSVHLVILFVNSLYCDSCIYKAYCYDRS